MLALRSLTRLHRSGARVYGSMHDPLDLVTGIERRELLAHLAGDCDPFRIMAIKKGKICYLSVYKKLTKILNYKKN